MKKKYVTLTTPPQTGTFTMPADFAANRRLIYYCGKTDKHYDIENLIAENLELKRKLNIIPCSKDEFEVFCQEIEHFRTGTIF